MEQKKGLVKAKSKAYGYDYASLSDIVKQGFDIPKMRVARHEGDDYIEYFDGQEWNLGARVVVPDMKGSNEAQRYGSAITYARRFTAQMALSLACDSDKEIEAKAPSGRSTAPQKTFNLKDADVAIKAAKTPDEVRKIYLSAPEHLRQYLEKGSQARIKELTK